MENGRKQTWRFELGLTCKAHVLHSCVAVLIKGEAYCICSIRRRMTEKQTPLGKTHIFPLKLIRLISYQNYCQSILVYR